MQKIEENRGTKYAKKKNRHKIKQIKLTKKF